MFFPIGDDNVRGGAKPIFSWIFLAINVAVFLLQVNLGEAGGEAFVLKWGYQPVEITSGQEWPSLVTSMFLHGGWMHLIGNMMFLWVFADNIEAAVGNARFAIFYLAGGLAAAAAHTLAGPFSDVPCVGASGAIAAVMGAYLVMFPSSKIRMIAILIFFFPRFNVPAFAFLGLWIVQQFFSGIGELGLETAETGGGVAWWAHIGGFVFGFLVGLFWRQRFGGSHRLGEEQA